MSEGRGEDFLEHSAADLAGPYLRAMEERQAPALHARIGPWRIVAEAGRGGMGTVYEAVRADAQFDQRVALKVVRGWLSLDDHHLRRFRDERRILAALDHPHIARLLDGGVTEDGTPWFAMEYVAGLPIDQHATANRLSIAERLRLLLQACEAVQYAHQQLVIHRDIKPANLLVTEAGVVKLLDFGVARLLGADAAGDGAAGVTAARLMTPAYASPEQLRGEQIAVASDVYALGVVMHQLLTGTLPHPVGDRQPHELARAILEEAPTQPSTVAPWHDRRALRGDLDTIVAVALRKEPSHRYGSVAALADDIRRHLSGRPIVARAHSRGYRLRTLLRRRRLELLAASVVLASLLVGILMARVSAARADTLRALAQSEAARAGQVAAFLSGLFQLADPNVALGDTVTIGVLLDSAASWLDWERLDDPEARAEIALTLGSIFGARGHAAAHGRMLDTALAIQEQLYGPDDPRVGITLTSRAEAMRGEGALAQAEPILRRALRLLERDSLHYSRELDHALNMLALSFRNQGRLAEAEAMLRRALRISRGNATAHPPGLHRTLTNLAHVLSAGGRQEPAETLHREVLSLRIAHWGPEHPEVANALINLATVVGHQSRFEEAESLFVRGLEMRRRVQGAHHAEVGIDLAGLAALYHRQGRDTLAGQTYAEALQIQRSSLGPRHPLVHATAESLAVLGRTSPTP
jgi:tetratricopeptide (TPR) repeat protein